jgi:hypothetical protein
MAGSPLLGRIRNRALRVRQHRWRVAPYRSGERHIVMGGAPRSGTTLLRKLLDRHPEVCAGAETKLFVPAAFNLAWLAESYAIPLDDLEAMRRAASSQAGFIDAFAARARAWTGSSSASRTRRSSTSSATAGTSSAPCASTPTGAGWMARGRRCWCRVPWSGTPSAGWRTPRPAWRAVGTADTWRSATRTSSPTPWLPCAQSASGSPSGSMRPGWRAHDAWTETAGDGGAGRSATRPDYEGAVTAVSVGRWQRDLTAAEQQEVERHCGARLRELGYLP